MTALAEQPLTPDDVANDINRFASDYVDWRLWRPAQDALLLLYARWRDDARRKMCQRIADGLERVVKE